MNERIVIAQASNLQVANLAQPRIVKVTKPQGDRSIIFDLNHDHSAKLDLSAVANEKLTLVHVGTKLVILFDNQSTVVADPFFDSSGKPFADLNVELGAGRGVNGEQFAQLFTITDDQSVLPDIGPPSGADFHDVSIDPLPDGPLPLALFGLQAQVGHLTTDVDDASSRHNINTPTSTVVGSAPGVVIPSPGGAGTQVFEAGLGARGLEPAGTHAGNPAFPITTRAGTISFNSADAVQSVSLGGHTLNDTAQTFTDATGSLTASFTYDAATGRGAIHYTYTLLDNTLGIPSASFAVVVTDKDGDSNPPANLVINIVDDGPAAIADTDAVAATQTTAETGNVLTGVGTTSGPSSADVQGADGSLQVSGVAAGNTGNPVNGGVGLAVAGAFGTLTLNADGSYSYVHAGAAGGGNDVFTYTIRDADGSQSTATLTIVVGDSAPGGFVIPPENTPGQTQVFEASLGPRGSEPAGSHAGDTSFPSTTAGTITFTSPCVRPRQADAIRRRILQL